MTTEIDVYALRQTTPLGCAQKLAELTSYELKAICTLLGLRFTRRADKSELAALITAQLHPTATPLPAAETQQLSLF